MLEFYTNRILSCPAYGFRAGHEILDLIMRCASNDSRLSEHDWQVIMELVEGAHIYMMEDNYNGDW